MLQLTDAQIATALRAMKLPSDTPVDKNEPNLFWAIGRPRSRWFTASYRVPIEVADYMVHPDTPRSSIPVGMRMAMEGFLEGVPRSFETPERFQIQWVDAAHDYFVTDAHDFPLKTKLRTELVRVHYKLET